MKNNFLTLIVCLFSVFVFSQTPQGMSYQAIAYDPGTNLPITNQTISLRFSVLDTSDTGTEIYAETFNGVVTNDQGVFSLNIGAGTAVNGTFDMINWGINTKFLKVEMDTANGANYTLVGTNQLMSVPYALYAQTAKQLDPANGGFEIVKNIYELKRNIEPIDNKLVYVKGYYQEGDGGGGFFLFKKDSKFGKNLGTIFKSLYGGDCIDCDEENLDVPCEKEGEWLRQYQGYMDVRYFGVLRDGWEWTDPYYNATPPNCWPHNNYQRIQDMIDYATRYANPFAQNHKTQHDLTIFFPSGSYFIEKTIYLKDRVHIIGGSEVKLINKEKRGTPDYDYMFELGPGPVSHLLIENLWIDCNRSGIGGFHFKPNRMKGDTKGLVGLWDSSFRNINIYDASKPGFYLEGPDYIHDGNGYKLDPQKWLQTLLFENIRAMRWDDPNEPALKLTGYNANYTFTNCEFTNSQFKNGDEHMFIDGPCITIGSNNKENEPKQGSYAISFINCGMGVYARYGAVIDNSSSITFDTGFYEGLDIAFVVRNSKQVKIVNNRFANASGMGSYCANVTYDGVTFDKRSHLDYAGGEFGAIVWADKSIVSVQNNNCDISSSTTTEIKKQYFTVGIGNNNVFDMNTNTFGIHELAKTLILYHVATIIGETIDTTNQKVVFVTTPLETYQDLKSIKSDLSTGEYLVIRANTGGVNFISMNDTANSISGSNIFLPPGTNSLKVDNGHTATFVRIEDTFQLISVQ